MKFTARAQELRQKAQEFLEEAAKLEQAALTPTEPPFGYYRVGVRFVPDGPIFTYLLLPTTGGWYTTGVADQSHFASWQLLWEWLEGDSVAEHGPVMELSTAETSPSNVAAGAKLNRSIA